MVVLEGLGRSMEDQESSRVAGGSWLGGNLIQGQGIGKKGGEGWGLASDLTGGED